MNEFVEKLDILLKGKIPEQIDAEKISDSNAQDVAERINRLINCMEEIQGYLLSLSRGVLEDTKISSNNFIASPFKALHSSLSHLTWQAKQVAKGDYSQRIDFMGDFSDAFNSMVVALDTNEKLLKKKIEELESALTHIEQLEGILPICSHCKKIRLEGAEAQSQEGWVGMESYFEKKTEAKFSHSICPECLEKYYPEQP